MNGIRTAIWAVLAVVLATTALAMVDTCGSTIAPNTSCTMLTPAIAIPCSNYSITNDTTLISQGFANPTIDSEIYAIPINLTAGGYIVHLCDGSTREIQVSNEDTMIDLAIILGLGIIIAIMFVLQHYFKEAAGDWAEWFNHGITIIILYLVPIVVLFLGIMARNAQLDSIADILDTIQLIAIGIAVVMTILYVMLFLRILYNAAKGLSDTKYGVKRGGP